MNKPSPLPHPAVRFGIDPTFTTPRLDRSEEHTSELQSQSNLVCRLLLEKKKYSNREFADGRVTGSQQGGCAARPGVRFSSVAALERTGAPDSRDALRWCAANVVDGSSAH